MTKQEWLKIRTLKEIPKQIWFSFYREKGGIIDNLEDFWKAFVEILSTQMMIFPQTQKRLTFKSALNQLYSYYNSKFEL